jgi:hypothetical protein
LVSAFPDYATALFAEQGLTLDRSAVEAIEAATARLDLELAAELEQAFVEQRHTPLELFGSALAGLDDQLDAPGSSAVLGEAVHAAHTAWGMAKAAAFTGGDPRGPRRPSVVVFTSDRVVRQQLCHTAELAGYHCEGARNPSAVATAVAGDTVKLAFVDLAHRAARDAVKRLTDADVPIVVFGTDVDDLTETGLLAAGVRTVLERDRLLSEAGRYLPTIA